MALGATSFEAVLPSIRNSLLTALTPHLNMLSVVGLVAIPGMMVGQLLGGSSPAIAAEYRRNGTTCREADSVMGSSTLLTDNEEEIQTYKMI